MHTPELADRILEFLAIYASVYAATALLYLAGGVAIDRLNSHFPERRIQTARRGEHRRRQETRQSLKSLFATALCLAFGLFAQRQGWTWTPLTLDVWSGLGMLALSIVLYDGWFYFIHRMQHTRALSRWHALHHRAVAPTAWSNYNDTVPDALGQQSYFAFAPFIIPIPPEVLIAHRLIDHINGMFGHCGFEHFAGRLAAWPSPMVCTTFHDQHHSGFNYNFANHFSVWDRVFGTLHPEYDTLAAAGPPRPPLASR